MSLQSRILLLIVAIFASGTYLLVDTFRENIRPNYREALESPLVDTAEVLAADLIANSVNNEIDTTQLAAALNAVRLRKLDAQIYGVTKHAVDVRVYVTNRNGTVLFHSEDPQFIGSDFSKWNDVYRTLRGQYGARSTRDRPSDPSSSVLYVAAPIVKNGELLGVLSLGKPAAESNERGERAAKKGIGIGIVVGLICVLLTALFSFWIFRPLRKLTTHVRALQSGKRATLTQFGKTEIGELADAFDQLYQTLEGKRYVEQYVQALTHELKSPLAGIRAAGEILQDDIDSADRNRFSVLLLNELERIDYLVEQLLELAKIERQQSLLSVNVFPLKDLLESSVDNELHALSKKQISVVYADDLSFAVQGDFRLMELAVTSIIRNALEFSPASGTITIGTTSTNSNFTLEVRDEGPGIPDYALSRLFERFYSLPRPDTGKKSSGLGLVLVREIILLHNGEIVVRNRTDRSGVEVLITLPK